MYRVLFDFNDDTHLGSFEKYKQDNTETLAYLLTFIDLEIPTGTVLQIPDKDDILKLQKIYNYLEI